MTISCGFQYDDRGNVGFGVSQETRQPGKASLRFPQN
jgi:hypothetical protein